MNDRLQRALDKVQADEALKRSTKAYLYRKTRGYAGAGAVRRRRLLPALACLALLLLGGRWLYFTPSFAISIDVNPSLELGVNRFDRIVSVQGYNSDGQELADSLNLKYLNYAEAVNRVLSSDTVRALLAGNELLAIGVVGSDDARSAEAVSKIESACTAGRMNAYCYYARSDEVREAHELGLSYGKYRAYCEYRALDPSITVEEVQRMTMRELRDAIDALSSGGDAGAGLENRNAHGGRGMGNGPGRGQGNGGGAGRP